MNIFVTGSRGLIGRRLVSILESSGQTITRLVRHVPQNGSERSWETGGRRMDTKVLEGCDALIHLAGEPIASGRWTMYKKDMIFHSRVESTAIFADAISRMANPPKVFIVASAIGYYGDAGDEILTEKSMSGEGFLPDVCRAWEAAADPAREITRVVHIRTGMVLSRKGGALKAMLLPFKLGLGGVVGSGEQYWSWISLEDIARLFVFALENDSIQGPVNGVSPQPLTNREFTQTLGRHLNRPTVFPLPGTVAKLALGEMAKELLLASTRVIPAVAQEKGFTFHHPDLESALNAS